MADASKMDDYSGPFRNRVNLDDFSREGLKKLVRIGGSIYGTVNRNWYRAVAEGVKLLAPERRGAPHSQQRITAGVLVADADAVEAGGELDRNRHIQFTGFARPLHHRSVVDPDRDAAVRAHPQMMDARQRHDELPEPLDSEWPVAGHAGCCGDARGIEHRVDSSRQRPSLRPWTIEQRRFQAGRRTHGSGQQQADDGCRREQGAADNPHAEKGMAADHRGGGSHGWVPARI